MTDTLKNQASIFFLTIAYFCAGLCEKIIETVLKSKVTFVIFSVSVAALTVTALAGIVIAIINIVAVFQKVIDVFRDAFGVLFG